MDLVSFVNHSLYTLDSRIMWSESRKSSMIIFFVKKRLVEIPSSSFVTH